MTAQHESHCQTYFFGHEWLENDCVLVLQLRNNFDMHTRTPKEARSRSLGRSEPALEECSEDRFIDDEVEGNLPSIWDCLAMEVGKGRGGGRRVEFSLKDPKVMRVQRWKNINSFHFRFLTPDWFQVQVIVFSYHVKNKALVQYWISVRKQPFSLKGPKWRCSFKYSVLCGCRLAAVLPLQVSQISDVCTISNARCFSLLHPNTSDPGFQHTDQTRARITVWYW